MIIASQSIPGAPIVVVTMLMRRHIHKPSITAQKPRMFSARCATGASMIAAFFSTSNENRANVGATNDTIQHAIWTRHDRYAVVSRIQEEIIESARRIFRVKQPIDWIRDVSSKDQLAQTRILHVLVEHHTEHGIANHAHHLILSLIHISEPRDRG